MNVVYEIQIGPYKQIGSTSNLKKRMNDHLRELISQTHTNSFMQFVYNKYKTFAYLILKECETREEAYKEEQLLLDMHYKKPGYMMLQKSAHGSSSGKDCIVYGIKRPDQSKRMKENNPMKNQETVKKISEKLKVVYGTEEMRKRCSDVWTEEKRKKQSVNKSGSGNGRAHKVICLETGKIFDTINDACAYFNRTRGTICDWHKKKIKVKILYDK